MGSRLERAITQLPPDKVEELADYAEFLLSKISSADQQERQFMKLDWAGKAADAYPECSGVEASHVAGELIRQKLDRHVK